MKPFAFCLLACVLAFPGIVQGQIIIIDPPGRPFPRPRPPFIPVPSEFIIKEVNLQAGVQDQSAKVQISQVFKNTGGATLEATFMFPVPDEAQISGLTLMVDGKELAGRLLKKEDARRIYEDIVRRRRDPALLEYIGQGLFQTSVFPIPPNAERTVEIRYAQLLRKDNGLVDLLLPIGTAKHANRPVEMVNVNVRVESGQPIKTIYSPTHTMEIARPDDKHAVCKLTLKNVTSPGDLRLMYGTEAGLVGMNLISYRPKKDEPGYFLLLAEPEVKTAQSKTIEKTMVFVVDRSGSMAGEKFKQAQDALKYLVNRLSPTDLFNIVAYDSNVESFRPELQKGDPTTIKAALGFIDGLFAGGSTNIDGALTTALAMLKDSSRPNYVLFLTDGLPTVGERNEMKIAANAKEGNKVKARMFNFGVGYDVNSRLLDRLSRDHRGLSVYVRPEENIEAHVSSLYNKIGSPLLTDVAIKFDLSPTPAAGTAEPISRTYPRELPDLFHGEQLVWVGRYNHPGDATVTMTGSLAGEKKTFTLSTKFADETKDETNGFVEKLWATRRIGEIIDELDLKGQNQELVDELVKLSIQHGIMTPYTSFLADENVNLAQSSSNVSRARANAEKDLGQLSGRSGFAQRAIKGQLQNERIPQAPAEFRKRSAPALGGDAKEAETIDVVKNVGQKTFFRKNKQWRDSTVTEEQEKQAIRVRQFSQEYFDLAVKHGGTLAKYIAFQEPVLVNLEGKTYQIDPADDAPPPSPN